MLLLAFSIFALFFGVLLFPVIQKRPSWLSFFDAFTLVSIILLTISHLIPHSIEGAGLAGVLSICIGIILPAALHFFSPHPHHEGSNAHIDNDFDDTGSNGVTISHAKHDRLKKFLRTFFTCLVLLGIAIHTLMDGMGLSMSNPHDGSTQMLAISVLFHRLPVGFFLSMILVPIVGLKKTWLTAVALACATTAGFLIGHWTLPNASLLVLNVLQGLIAGTLLHVIFHNIAIGGHAEFKYAKGVGALFGILAFAIITWIIPVHAHTHETTISLWLDMTFRTAPLWCLFAAILAPAYILKNSKTFHRLSKFLRHTLDPQQRPVNAGGPLHIFAATTLLFTFGLLNGLPAFSWWCAILCATLAARKFSAPAACKTCQREGYCDLEKSFSLWTTTSIGQISLGFLTASLLPVFVQPFTPLLNSIPTPWLIILAALAAISVIHLGILKNRLHAIKNFPIPIHAVILFFLLLLCACLHDKTAQAVIAFIAMSTTAALCAASESNTSRHPARTACICLIPVLIIGSACFISTQSNPPNHSEPQQQAMTDHHANGHFQTIAPWFSNAISHDVIETAQHDEQHEHGNPSTSHIAPGVFKDQQGNWMLCAILQHLAWLLMLLTALRQIFIAGPRQFFETAIGKRHHKHDVSP